MNAKVPQFTIPRWLAPHVAEVRAWSAVRGPNPRCLIAVCTHSGFSLGLCRDHYDNLRARAKRRGQSLAGWLAAHVDEAVQGPALVTGGSVCWVSVCERSAVSHGLCKAHAVTARRRFREEQNVVPTSDSETSVQRVGAGVLFGRAATVGPVANKEKN